jgi:hypothetical protein
VQAEKRAVSDHLARRWSWGAFLLPWLWPFRHGVPWLGIVTLFCILLSPWIVPAVVWVGFAVFLGIKGGEIAVRHRAYGGDDEYRKVERAWATGGVLAAIASIPVGIGLIFLGYLIAAMVSPTHY